jgi:hypothetical protein
MEDLGELSLPLLLLSIRNQFGQNVGIPKIAKSRERIKASN